MARPETLRAAQAGKASLQAATGEELFDGAHDDRAERAATGFEAIFVGPDAAVIMILKQAVKAVLSGCLGRYTAGGSATCGS